VDPFVEEFWIREHDFTYGNSGPGVKTLPLTHERLKRADIVLITTDHTEFPYEEIVEKSSIIFDTRNATGFRNIQADKIFKLSTRVSENNPTLAERKKLAC